MPYQYEVSPEQFLKSDDVSRYPAGMRNNNPGNLKYSGSRWQQSHFPGMLGPSTNKDEGQAQIVFASPKAGAEAMSRLLLSKYDSGLDTPRKIITDKTNGWTPGNPNAAVNIAKSLGVDQDTKLDLRDPDQLANLQRALITQEHGPQGSAYHPLVANAVQSALGSAPTGTPAAALQATATPATPAVPTDPRLAQLQGLLGNLQTPTPSAGLTNDDIASIGASLGSTPAAAADAPTPKAQAAQEDTSDEVAPSRPNWGDEAPGRNVQAERMISASTPSRRGLLADSDPINTIDLQQLQGLKANSRLLPQIQLSGLLGRG